MNDDRIVSAKALEIAAILMGPRAFLSENDHHLTKPILDMVILKVLDLAEAIEPHIRTGVQNQTIC